MTRPRCYLAGAVDRLPDLGVAWRVDVAAALEADGCEPVWPTEEMEYLAKHFAGNESQAGFTRRSWGVDIDHWRRDPAHNDHPIAECFERLSTCDVILVRWCAGVGPGTRAEIAYAVAIGLPVVTWVVDIEYGPDDALFYALGLDKQSAPAFATADESIKCAAQLGAARVAARSAPPDPAPAPGHTSPIGKEGGI